MFKKLILAVSAVSMLALVTSPMADEGDSKERTAGEVVDDMIIATWLKSAFAADPVTDAIEIDIEVDKKHVQLNGFVDNEEERNRAQEIAMNTQGVASVDNNLELQPRDRTAAEFGSDKVLVGKVKAALAGDPVAHSLKIDVEVDHGTVSLGGHVNSEEERNAALLAVKDIEGVKKVIDNLEIRS